MLVYFILIIAVFVFSHFVLKFKRVLFSGVSLKDLGVYRRLIALWTDKRERLFFKQRWTRGFSDDELWSLDHTLAKFILPRLKAFNQIYRKENIQSMIFAMEQIANGEHFTASGNQANQIQRGCKLFGKYFMSLWY